MDEIMKKLVAIETRLVRLEDLISKARDSKVRTEGSEAGRVAEDAELDGKYGDPQVWIETLDGWEGGSYKEKPMSDCPADFLVLYADFLDRLGNSKQAKGDEKYWRFHKDAARARAWAKRMDGDE